MSAPCLLSFVTNTTARPLPPASLRLLFLQWRTPRKSCGNKPVHRQPVAQPTRIWRFHWPLHSHRLPHQRRGMHHPDVPNHQLRGHRPCIGHHLQHNLIRCDHRRRAASSLQPDAAHNASSWCACTFGSPGPEQQYRGNCGQPSKGVKLHVGATLTPENALRVHHAIPSPIS